MAACPLLTDLTHTLAFWCTGFDYLSEAGAQAVPLRFVTSYHHEQQQQARGHEAQLHHHSGAAHNVLSSGRV